MAASGETGKISEGGEGVLTDLLGDEYLEDVENDDDIFLGLALPDDVDANAKSESQCGENGEINDEKGSDQSDRNAELPNDKDKISDNKILDAEKCDEDNSSDDEDTTRVNYRLQSERKSFEIKAFSCEDESSIDFSKKEKSESNRQNRSTDERSRVSRHGDSSKCRSQREHDDGTENQENDVRRRRRSHSRDSKSSNWRERRKSGDSTHSHDRLRDKSRDAHKSSTQKRSADREKDRKISGSDKRHKGNHSIDDEKNGEIKSRSVSNKDSSHLIKVPWEDEATFFGKFKRVVVVGDSRIQHLKSSYLKIDCDDVVVISKPRLCLDGLVEHLKKHVPSKIKPLEETLFVCAVGIYDIMDIQDCTAYALKKLNRRKGRDIIKKMQSLMKSIKLILNTSSAQYLIPETYSEVYFTTLLPIDVEAVQKQQAKLFSASSDYKDKFDCMLLEQVNEIINEVNHHIIASCRWINGLKVPWKLLDDEIWTDNDKVYLQDGVHPSEVVSEKGIAPSLSKAINHYVQKRTYESVILLGDSLLTQMVNVNPNDMESKFTVIAKPRLSLRTLKPCLFLEKVFKSKRSLIVICLGIYGSLRALKGVDSYTVWIGELIAIEEILKTLFMETFCCDIVFSTIYPPSNLNIEYLSQEDAHEIEKAHPDHQLKDVLKNLQDIKSVVAKFNDFACSFSETFNLPKWDICSTLSQEPDMLKSYDGVKLSPNAAKQISMAHMNCRDIALKNFALQNRFRKDKRRQYYANIIEYVEQYRSKERIGYLQKSSLGMDSDISLSPDVRSGNSDSANGEDFYAKHRGAHARNYGTMSTSSPGNERNYPQDFSPRERRYPEAFSQEERHYPEDFIQKERHYPQEFSQEERRYPEEFTQTSYYPKTERVKSDEGVVHNYPEAFQALEKSPGHASGVGPFTYGPYTDYKPQRSPSPSRRKHKGHGPSMQQMLCNASPERRKKRSRSSSKGKSMSRLWSQSHPQQFYSSHSSSSRSRSPLESKRKRSPSPPHRDPVVRKALQSLREVHEKECSMYRMTITAHPDYGKEYRAFSEKKTKSVIALGCDPDEYDIREDWNKFWLSRIEELFDESWKSKKRQCIRMLRNPSPSIDKNPHTRRGKSSSPSRNPERRGSVKSSKSVCGKNRSPEDTARHKIRSKERRRSSSKELKRVSAVQSRSLKSEEGIRDIQRMYKPKKEEKLKRAENRSPEIHPSPCSVLKAASLSRKLSQDNEGCIDIKEWLSTKRRELNSVRSRSSSPNLVEDLNFAMKSSSPNLYSNEEKIFLKENSRITPQATRISTDSIRNSDLNIMGDENVTEPTDSEEVIEVLSLLCTLADKLKDFEEDVKELHEKAVFMKSKKVDAREIFFEARNRCLLCKVKEQFKLLLCDVELNVIKKAIVQETAIRLNQLLIKGNEYTLDVDICLMAQNCLSKTSAETMAHIKNFLLLHGYEDLSKENLKRFYVKVKASQTKLLESVGQPESLEMEANHLSRSVDLRKFSTDNPDHWFTSGSPSPELAVSLKSVMLKNQDSGQSSAGSHVLPPAPPQKSSYSTHIPSPLSSRMQHVPSPAITSASVLQQDIRSTLSSQPSFVNPTSVPSSSSMLNLEMPDTKPYTSGHSVSVPLYIRAPSKQNSPVSSTAIMSSLLFSSAMTPSPVPSPYVQPSPVPSPYAKPSPCAIVPTPVPPPISKPVPTPMPPQLSSVLPQPVPSPHSKSGTSFLSPPPPPPILPKVYPSSIASSSQLRNNTDSQAKTNVQNTADLFTNTCKTWSSQIHGTLSNKPAAQPPPNMHTEGYSDIPPSKAAGEKTFTEPPTLPSALATLFTNSHSKSDVKHSTTNNFPKPPPPPAFDWKSVNREKVSSSCEKHLSGTEVLRSDKQHRTRVLDILSDRHILQSVRQTLSKNVDTFSDRYKIEPRTYDSHLNRNNDAKRNDIPPKRFSESKIENSCNTSQESKQIDSSSGSWHLGSNERNVSSDSKLISDVYDYTGPIDRYCPDLTKKDANFDQVRSSCNQSSRESVVSFSSFLNSFGKNELTSPTNTNTVVSNVENRYAGNKPSIVRQPIKITLPRNSESKHFCSDYDPLYGEPS